MADISSLTKLAELLAVADLQSITIGGEVGNRLVLEYTVSNPDGEWQEFAGFMDLRTSVCWVEMAAELAEIVAGQVRSQPSEAGLDPRDIAPIIRHGPFPDALRETDLAEQLRVQAVLTRRFGTGPLDYADGFNEETCGWHRNMQPCIPSDEEPERPYCDVCGCHWMNVQGYHYIDPVV